MDILKWIALTIIAVIACIPLFAGSSRFRPCYTGAGSAENRRRSVPPELKIPQITGRNRIHPVSLFRKKPYFRTLPDRDGSVHKDKGEFHDP